jgi:glycerol-3-phosphate acyltransferase PlsY
LLAKVSLVSEKESRRLNDAGFDVRLKEELMPFDLAVWLVVGYMLGSIPFGVLVTRLLRAPDPRLAGSGHTGAMNTWRQAGLPAAVATALGDLGKGATAAHLAAHFGLSPHAPTVAAMAAIAGHCWPLFAGFRGGMGLGTTVGALTATWPPGTVIFGVTLLGLVGLTRRSAPSSVVTIVTTPALLWGVGAPVQAVELMTGCSLVLLLRYIPLMARGYRGTLPFFESESAGQEQE